MLKVYAADQVRQALPWGALCDTLAQAFIAGAQVPLRHRHDLGDGANLLLMPAWSDAGLGVKIVTVAPGNAARGLATVQAQYLLLERATGVARALIDGDSLTQRRTAAVSALAARHMARTDSQTLLVVGAGHMAGALAQAHAALQPNLREIGVWARRDASAQALAQTLRDAGLPAQAVSDLEAAVRAADIISCATTSTQPLVRGEWLREGTHLDLIGAYRSDMREVDDSAVQRARVVVDTLDGALAEAGDLVQPLRSGAIIREHVLGDLADLLCGRIQGRRDARDITLFKSVGTALADLAAAERVAASA